MLFNLLANVLDINLYTVEHKLIGHILKKKKN